MKWVVWVQHLGSRSWYELGRSDEFEWVYRQLVQYVRNNHVIVKFHILMSNASPDTLPSHYPAPMEMRG